MTTPSRLCATECASEGRFHRSYVDRPGADRSENVHILHMEDNGMSHWSSRRRDRAGSSSRREAASRRGVQRVAGGGVPSGGHDATPSSRGTARLRVSWETSRHVPSAVTSSISWFVVPSAASQRFHVSDERVYDLSLSRSLISSI